MFEGLLWLNWIYFIIMLVLFIFWFIMLLDFISTKMDKTKRIIILLLFLFLSAITAIIWAIFFKNKGRI